MLLNLHVKNIALIDEVDIDFDKGLNILTGETGAGKSILIDSVNFALGARMPKDVVREDAEQALCELVFSVEGDTEASLKELEVEPEDGCVILTRKIVNGKSSLRCNGETITTSKAKEIAALLIDIHGQHEHQSLLYKNNHRKILDEYCGSDFAKLKTEYLGVYADYRAKAKELDSARNQNSSKDADIDYCSFVIDEITNARLVQGEDDELEEQFSRMNNARRIAEAVAQVRDYVEDGESAASSSVSRAVAALRQASSYDSDASGLYEQLSEIENLMQDFSRSLSDYEDSLVFSPEDFARVEERLDEINRLKMKYAPTIEGILKHLDEEQQKYEKLTSYDDYLNNLETEVERLLEEVIKLCGQMSSIRSEQAKILSEDIRKSLSDLNFLDARFEIIVESSEDNISENGFDDIEFMISTNPGEKIKPLTQVASGGELSRIMLALKSVFAGKDSIGTLIFDEIDTGISGITAQLVARKMSHIAANHQVICVTHLPQIASFADNHFMIEKSAANEHTSTSVSLLDEEASIMELARMLSGTQITDATVANAREMKNAAKIM